MQKLLNEIKTFKTELQIQNGITRILSSKSSSELVNLYLDLRDKKEFLQEFDNDTYLFCANVRDFIAQVKKKEKAKNILTTFLYELAYTQKTSDIIDLNSAFFVFNTIVRRAELSTLYALNRKLAKVLINLKHNIVKDYLILEAYKLENPTAQAVKNKTLEKFTRDKLS